MFYIKSHCSLYVTNMHCIGSDCRVYVVLICIASVLTAADMPYWYASHRRWLHIICRINMHCPPSGPQLVRCISKLCIPSDCKLYIILMCIAQLQTAASMQCWYRLHQLWPQLISLIKTHCIGSHCSLYGTNMHCICYDCGLYVVTICTLYVVFIWIALFRIASYMSC